MSPRVLLTASIVALTVLGGAGDVGARAPAGFWQKSLLGFAKQDKKRDAPKHGVVFVGSSSIRLWKTATSFPTLPTVNRGLGGARIDDMIGLADRLVFPREPKVIVFYAGENDIGAGATPQQVLADYRTFVRLVRARLPNVTMLYLSIKPSLALRHAWPRAKEANRLIAGLCEADPTLLYVDVATPMLSATGKPRPELFRKDGLHMNEAGYRVWNGVVAPVVQAAFARR